jgi:hypothetical protein
MPVITIPFDYDQQVHSSVVPICIEDMDAEGNVIHPDWFKYGVLPAADKLRQISRRMLHDVWRVSEITEHAVHSVWRHRGTDFPNNPDIVIYRRAKWHAEDLRAGGRRARIGADVELFSSTVDLLRDQFEMAADAGHRDTLDRLVAQAEQMGMADAAAMVPMMLRGCGAEEYIKRFGKKRNTLTQMFFRHMRKAAEAADLSW